MSSQNTNTYKQNKSIIKNWRWEMGCELVDYLLSAQKQEVKWEHATGLVHQWQK